MDSPKTKELRDRKTTMTIEQRANLELLAIVTNRLALRNERLERGLQFGFRTRDNDSETSRLTPLGRTK